MSQKRRPAAGFKAQLAYPNQRAVIGMVSTGHSEDAFWESVIESKELDDRGWRRFQRPWRIRVKSSANISRGRNTVIREFLALPHRPPWLFIVDTDMAWDADAFERLLLEAKPDRIVGGLCFAYGKGRTIIPTIFAADELGRLRPIHEIDSEWKLPENTMVQVDGTGAAFLCVHRDALESMADKWTEAAGFRSDNLWFREHEMLLPLPEPDADGATVQVHWTSEDLWFCHVAADAGVDVFVHTGVKVRHRKQVWLDEALYRSDYSAMSW